MLMAKYKLEKEQVSKERKAVKNVGFGSFILNL